MACSRKLGTLLAVTQPFNKRCGVRSAPRTVGVGPCMVWSNSTILRPLSAQTKQQPSCKPGIAVLAHMLPVIAIGAACFLLQAMPQQPSLMT